MAQVTAHAFCSRERRENRLLAPRQPESSTEAGSAAPPGHAPGEPLLAPPPGSLAAVSIPGTGSWRADIAKSADLGFKLDSCTIVLGFRRFKNPGARQKQ